MATLEFNRRMHGSRSPVGGGRPLSMLNPGRPQESMAVSRMTDFYQKMGHVDPERRFPLELVHLLVKAAARDPLIAQELDQAVRRMPYPGYGQYVCPPPVSQPAPAPSAPTKLQFMPPAGPSVGSSSAQQTVPSHSATGPQAMTGTPVDAPAPTKDLGAAQIVSIITSSGSRLDEAASRALSDIRAQFKPKSRKRKAADTAAKQPATRRRKQTTKQNLSLAKTRKACVEEERPISPQSPPPKSASLPTPSPEDSGIALDSESDGNAETEDPEEDAEDEETADYKHLLDEVETDLGWHGKYATYTDAQMMDAGMHACERIEGTLEYLSDSAMGKHRAFENRVHVLSVMREILLVVVDTPSQVGREVRSASANTYGRLFLSAARKLTAGQRTRLRTHDNGQWICALVELNKRADELGVFKKAWGVLNLLDPKTAENTPRDGD